MELISNVSEALKEDYGPGLVEELNNASPTLKLFESKDTDGLDVGGKYCAYPLHFSRNVGTGSAGENETLPVAGNQAYADVNAYYKYVYGRFSVSRPALKASIGKKAAFVNIMDQGMKGLVRDLSRDRNRMMWGFGSGVLARVNGQQTTSATLNIRDAGGAVYNDSNGTPIGAGRYFLKGQRIIFIRPLTTLAAAANADIVSSATVMTVSSISSDLNTLTLAAVTGITLNDGDYIVGAPGNVATEASINKDPMGLLGIVDDGSFLTTLHNISRTTYPEFKGVVRTLNGDFDLDYLQRAEDLCHESGVLTDDDDMVLISHFSVQREYKKQLMLVKRYVNDFSMNPDAGFKKKLSWNEHPWTVDRMAPYGMLFGISPKNNKRFNNGGEGGWVDDDGTTILRVADKDSFEARWAIYQNFINDTPNSCFRVEKINTSVDVAKVV